jgi:hypothetical protein
MADAVIQATWVKLAIVSLGQSRLRLGYLIKTYTTSSPKVMRSNESQSMILDTSQNAESERPEMESTLSASGLKIT